MPFLSLTMVCVSISVLGSRFFWGSGIDIWLVLLVQYFLLRIDLISKFLKREEGYMNALCEGS